jgi:hypothetical protein
MSEKIKGPEPQSKAPKTKNRPTLKSLNDKLEALQKIIDAMTTRASEYKSNTTKNIKQSLTLKSLNEKLKALQRKTAALTTRGPAHQSNTSKNIKKRLTLENTNKQIETLQKQWAAMTTRVPENVKSTTEKKELEKLNKKEVAKHLDKTDMSKLKQITQILEHENSFYKGTNLEYKLDSIIKEDNNFIVVTKRSKGIGQAVYNKMSAKEKKVYDLQIFNVVILGPDGSEKRVNFYEKKFYKNHLLVKKDGDMTRYIGHIDNDGYEPMDVMIDFEKNKKPTASVIPPNSIWRLRDNHKAGQTLTEQLKKSGLKVKVNSVSRNRGLTGTLKINTKNIGNIKKKLEEFVKKENAKLNGGKMFHNQTLKLTQNSNNPDLIDFKFEK